MADETSEPSSFPKGLLVVDNTDGEPEPDLLDMLKTTAAELGYDVAVGPVVVCKTCGYFECVCAIRLAHKEKCRYRKTAESMIAFPCEKHGLDVCVECDACDCK